MEDIKRTINCLRLIRSENVGSRTFQALLLIHGTVEKALDAIPQMAAKGGRKKPVKLFSEKDAIKEIENCEKKGARIITLFDKEYPKLLKHISDYPPVLTVYGKADVLNKPSVAIVGARNSSSNGCSFARNLCMELGRNNLYTVSGLARGIDTAAHKGSLGFGTIAVVAGGIDIIYPPENKELFKQIGEKGAVVAEMPFGEAPKAQNFPRRNRIISGMAKATAVIEASLNSGSLITARMALEQDREVFAVPGSPLDPRCAGTNKLIKQGAYLLTSADDILQLVDYSLQDDFLLEEGNNLFSQSNTVNLSDSELDGARPQVIEKIGCSPTAIDDIIVQTGFPAHIVLSVILELELAGRLERNYGNKVSMIYEIEDFLV
ncbi:MAG: DNA-protecting protein DprA [Alphaproteobacteria bacterium CG11_big_fil_rev_8_21_14_0_20_39_49]|nr:MAG: DNA-protecting protein DprA [Alphaproteobacteria bacterium CG11_big_fil_rev_8_21_14_0_20_39_49]